MKTLLLIGLFLIQSFAFASNFDSKLYLSSNDVETLELDWKRSIQAQWDKESNQFNLILTLKAPENYKIENALQTSDPGTQQIYLKSLTEQKIVKIIGENNSVLTQGLLHIQLRLNQNSLAIDEACPSTLSLPLDTKKADNYLIKVTCDGFVRIDGIYNSHVINQQKNLSSPTSNTHETAGPTKIKNSNQSLQLGINQAIKKNHNFASINVAGTISHPFHALEARHYLNIPFLSFGPRPFSTQTQKYYVFDSNFHYQLDAVTPFFGFSYRILESSLATANVGLSKKIQNFTATVATSLLESNGANSLAYAEMNYQDKKYFYQLRYETIHLNKHSTQMITPSIGTNF